MTAEVEGVIEDDHMIGDARIAEKIRDTTEDEEMENVMTKAKEENANEVKDDLIVTEGEAETVEEKEEDQEIGVIDIARMDHNNAMNIRTQVSVGTRNEQDIIVSMNMENQRRKRTATLKVEDPQMAEY